MLRVVLLTSILVLCQSAVAQVEPDSSALFRYAYFGNDWTVTLDEPINIPDNLLENGTVTREKQGAYRLRLSTRFDYGLVPITVTLYTAPDDRVRSMRFAYGDGFDFDHQRQSYEETLGPPSSSEPDLVAWEDDTTHFRLARGDKGAYSILRSLRGTRP